MKHKLYFLFFLLVLAGGKAFSQDTLYYKNGSKQIVKIVEVGLDDIKYRDFQNPDAPVFNVSKPDLRKIMFMDGNKLVFEEDPLDLTPSTVSVNKTHAIKIEFLSPIGGSLALGYEKLIKKGMSFETKAGLIGAGFDPNDENPGGGYVKFGVKFISTPTYYVRGMKRTHPLRGWYAKPEFIFSKYGVDRIPESYGWYYPYTTTQSSVRVNYTNYAMNLVIGKQVIMGEAMTLDFYGGIGYGGQSSDFKSTGNPDTDNYLKEFNRAYSHTYGGSSSPIIFSGGISLGILF